MTDRDPRYVGVTGHARHLAGGLVEYRVQLAPGITIRNLIGVDRPAAAHTSSLDRVVEELDAKLAQQGHPRPPS